VLNGLEEVVGVATTEHREKLRYKMICKIGMRTATRVVLGVFATGMRRGERRRRGSRPAPLTAQLRSGRGRGRSPVATWLAFGKYRPMSGRVGRLAGVRDGEANPTNAGDLFGRRYGREVERRFL
jgi:hypothetical protein